MSTMDWKRIGINAVWAVGAMSAAVLAQDVGSMTTAIQTANQQIFTYIKVAIQAGCFIWVVIDVAKIFLTSGDKQTNWWRIISLIAFIGVLQALPAIYDAVTGGSNSGVH